LHQDNNQRKRCMPKQPTATAETEPRRRARSKEAKALKRRTLLQAALDLFMAHGFQGTSIEMITDRAGESTGTFYLYFKNKVDIYRTLTNEGYEILNERLMESVSWPGMNTVAKISSAIQAYYRFYRDYPGHYRIINILHINQPEFIEDRRDVERLNRLAAGLLKFFAEIIQEGIDNNELNPVDPWKTTNAIWGMLDGLFLMEIRNNMDIPGLPLDDLIKQGLDILLQGLVRKD
jgi:AcrR family transcriptional regulator